MKERRRHTRIDSLNLLAFTCFDNDGNMMEQGMGRTLNVSISGILLETNVALEAECSVSITIAIEENLVDIQGFVVRSRPNTENMFESGIRFSDVSEREKEVIHAYIDMFEDSLA